MQTKKAVAAGHICLDITPVFPKGSAGTELSHFLRPGKLTEVEASAIHTGGSVANTGIAMKVLGADVRLIGKVGADAFGEMIRHILDEYGAGGDLIVSEGETTSYTIVIAPPGVDRLFLHCPGANDSFSGEDIPAAALNDIALFHFGYPPLLRRMRENGGAELVRLLKDVKAQGIATSLDLADVDPASDAGKVDWKQLLTDTLPYVDFFVPSYEELCGMLDKPRLAALRARAGDRDLTDVLDPEDDIRPLAEMCIAMGAKAVLLKCGAPGMYLITSTETDKIGRRLELDADAWRDFSRFERSFRIDRVLSGTGAGDTSIAAFLTAVLGGCGPEEALQLASAEGALCCTAYDAVSGLLPFSKVREKISAGWEKAAR